MNGDYKHYKIINIFFYKKYYSEFKKVNLFEMLQYVYLKKGIYSFTDKTI